MAKQEEKKVVNGGSVSELRPPAGFQRQGSASNAPWFKLQKGAVLHGKLMGRFKRKDAKSPTGESNFYQVELAEDCQCSEGKGADAKIIEAKKGTTVNVNYTKKFAESLDPFLTAVLRGTEVVVWAVVKNKLATQAGNGFWDVDVHTSIPVPAMMADDSDEDGPAFDEE